ncbi:MAG: DUF91 domain-containing protein, partial [Acidobacteriota bacterium]|nr:DUF91 domain-containing protein [Acidobacteriota bacterium]
YVIFYLQQNAASSIKEGKFYGIFRVRATPSFLDHNDETQFLGQELGKSLTFRTIIEPDRVYAKGVTEWEALDEIRNIQSPNQMLWSLIYRKLKGNRGNTMITIYESERLRKLIRDKNNREYLESQNYSFDVNSQEIIISDQEHHYIGRQEILNVLPRLITKYRRSQQFETHLQAYIVQNLERINIFEQEQIEWIGNEVSCGVGMQRIDIMLSVLRNDERVCIPIELKSISSYLGITNQLQRYVDWIEQYYISNRPSDIEPMIISRKIEDKTTEFYNNLINEFVNFNERNNTLKARYIEFGIDIPNQIISFEEVDY